MRREVPAGAGHHRMLNGGAIDSAHMALDSDCFSHATASTRRWMPACTRLAVTMPVAPPTEPAVCTRSSGLPTAPSASARYSSGIITPSNRSGALPDHDRVDVGEGEPGVGQRAVRRLPAQSGHRHVGALGPVPGLAHAENRGLPVFQSSCLHDADQVLLQRGPAGRVPEGAVAPGRS